MSQTNTAMSALLVARGKTHGAFDDNARIAGHLRGVLREAPNWKRLSWPQQLALEEIALKMARLLSAGSDPNFQEPWDDIAGYATLGSKACLTGEAKPRDMYIPMVHATSQEQTKCKKCGLYPPMNCGKDDCPQRQQILRTETGF